MNSTRRRFVATTLQTVGALALVAAAPHAALACLIGTWKVRCPVGHIDTVDAITCNHTCEKCGRQAFRDGVGDVVCPNGHVNHVSTGNQDEQDKWIKSLKCSTCKAECSIPPKRGGIKDPSVGAEE